VPWTRFPSFAAALRARWFEIVGGAVMVLLLIWLACVLVLDQRERTNRTTCLSNLRQIGQALHQYVADYDGCWPDSGAWLDGRIGKIGKPGALTGCPSARPMRNLPGLKAGGLPGYAYNLALSVRVQRNVLTPTHSRDIAFPTTTVSVCEQAIGISTTTEVDPYRNLPSRPPGQEKGWLRHGKGAHYLFCDGHARWLLPSRVKGLTDPAVEGKGNDGKTPSFAPFGGGR
jgi:prepilin-type processing-associated H-X9-DG protein